METGSTRTHRELSPTDTVRADRVAGDRLAGVRRRDPGRHPREADVSHQLQDLGPGVLIVADDDTVGQPHASP